MFFDTELTYGIKKKKGFDKYNKPLTNFINKLINKLTCNVIVFKISYKWSSLKVFLFIKGEL